MLNNGTDLGYIRVCIEAGIPRLAAQDRLETALKTKNIEIIKYEISMFSPRYDNSRYLQDLLKEDAEVYAIYKEHKKNYYKQKREARPPKKEKDDD